MTSFRKSLTVGYGKCLHYRTSVQHQWCSAIFHCLFFNFLFLFSLSAPRHLWFSGYRPLSFSSTPMVLCDFHSLFFNFVVLFFALSTPPPMVFRIPSPTPFPFPTPPYPAPMVLGSPFPRSQRFSYGSSPSPMVLRVISFTPFRPNTASPSTRSLAYPSVTHGAPGNISFVSAFSPLARFKPF